ncbi:MAG: phage tail protein [Endozoicomonas sp. (ex Botrylloides leachii)]|nr:phage tail protein [Endozoicomonas sp. (ex Botrylloides leachii)]
MNETLMTLGDYRFGINTAAYQTLQRTSRYQWQAQHRMGNKPMQQFTGTHADTVTLEGFILPHYKGGLLQVHLMRIEAGKGQPLLMTDGLGTVWGQWCITELRETHSDLISNGAPRHIRFQLSLVEYGDDNINSVITGSIEPIERGIA